MGRGKTERCFSAQSIPLYATSCNFEPLFYILTHNFGFVKRFFLKKRKKFKKNPCKNACSPKTRPPPPSRHITKPVKQPFFKHKAA